MAKMFYSLEEAADRLGKSVDDVRGMAKSGQLQEFRDRDRLMFKKDQVDLLAGGDDEISLADDLEPISLASSGSGTGLGLADSREGTGVSIFDAESTDDSDPSAATVMSATAGQTAPDFPSIDPAASGSGLLDLTREADDTSLGADLLQGVYGESDEGGAAPAGDLFESTGAETDVAAAPVAMLAVGDSIDPKSSGFIGGAALGMSLALLATIGLVALVMIGVGQGSTGAAATGGMLETVAGQIWVIVGAMAGAIVVFGILGMLIGGKSAR